MGNGIEMLKQMRESVANLGNPAKGPLLTQPGMGAGAVPAMLRQGLKELGSLVKAFPDSMQVDEPGTIGNITPQLITAQMTGQEIKGRQVDLDLAR